MNQKQGLVLNRKTADGRTINQSSARPIGTFVCFTSKGDDDSNPLCVGNGKKMIIDHKIGDPINQSVYVDLNVKENKTFMSEGYAIWKDCIFDELHMNVVPKLTPFVSGTNTTFNLYGGFLIVPAAGDGSIQVDPSQIQLVEIPFSADEPDKRQGSAFWDADYNLQTHQFENLRPNIYGTGQYNIFGNEINFESVVNISLLNFGGLCFHTNDVAEFGHGMRLKFIFDTEGVDHNWQCSINMTLNRQFTT